MGFILDRRQTAPYSPELEPDMVLTQPDASDVDETCIPLKVASFRCTEGRITLHWVAELIVFSTRMRIKQIRAHYLASFV